MKRSDNHFSLPKDPNGTLIRMIDIEKVFKTAGGEVQVLKGINLEIHQGEFVSVVGRSGSGKTTLINMLTGIDHPTRGRVLAGEVDIHSLNESDMSIWRGHNLGIVFQFFQLLPMLTLLENVMLPMDFCNLFSPTEREKRALELLDLVGLAPLANKLPGAVSGGQQQTAAVARALANDPPIIIADEPTGNLDSRTARQVMTLFHTLHKAGKTIIMVTHDRSLAEQAQRILTISDGELVNETIYKTFPNLSHANLLKLTHMATPLQFAAGSSLSPDDVPGDLFLVSSGQIEIFAPQSPGNNAKPAVILKPGNFLKLEHIQKIARLNGRVCAGQSASLQVLAFQRAQVAPILISSHSSSGGITV